jgi:hypothetical protein
MHAPIAEYLLYYKISVEPDGVKLRIWESPADDNASKETFLYILNCRASSMAEAKAQLRQHLTLNGGLLSTAGDLPQKGSVKLLPFPTLEQANSWQSDDDGPPP